MLPLTPDGDPLYSDLVVQTGIKDLVGLLRRTMIDPAADQGQRTDASVVLALLAAEDIEAANPAAWSASGSISSDSPVADVGSIHLSPSSLGTAQECALHWYFNSIQGEDRDAGEGPQIFGHAELGTLIHAIAEDLPHGTQEELQAELDRRWAVEGPGTDGYWNQYTYSRAQAMVDNLAAHFAGVQGDVVVEKRVDFEVGQAKVSGRLDRIEIQPDGRALVVDIKTGRLPARPQDNPQLLAYQVGITDLGYTPGGAALLGVSPDDGKKLARQEPLTPDQVQQTRAELAELSETLSGPTLLAHAGYHCRMCPFRAACPAQNQGEGGRRD